MYYLVGPDLYYVDPNNWDMWVNGVMVANDLEAGMLSGEDPMDSWMFYSSKSTSNLATLYLDDITLLSLDFLLPVTLQSFDLNQDITQVNLNWTTGSEQNTTIFDIERSTDGQNFLKIGEITAAGSSSSLIKYSFTDVDPRPGINYYQLKINYSDGTSDRSQVLLTEELGGNTSGLLGIYPSPATNQISIENQSFINDGSILMILDITGNKIKEFDYTNSSIDVSDLSSGIYMLLVKNREAETCSYFVKQ